MAIPGALFVTHNAFQSCRLDDPLVGTTIVGGVNVLATYAVLFLMDRCGRRTLILWSSGVMFLSCVFIVASLLGFLGNIVALLAVNVYVIFFEFGYVRISGIFVLHWFVASPDLSPRRLGPIPWLIVAEMFSGKYVAVAMGVSSQLNWACNFVVG